MPAPSETFRRFLHRTYSRGTGINYFFARRIRPAGIGLCCALIITSMFGVGEQRAPVYLIFSFTFALGLIAVPWAMLRRARGLQAHRTFPHLVTAGETARGTIRLVNPGKRRIASAWLTETPPDPRPNLVQFLRTTEPGEAKRNLFDRTFIYYRWQWLLERRRLFEGGRSLESFALKPGESIDLTIELTPRRRGVIRLDDLRVLLPDPFGFFQRVARISAPPATLTVLPPRYRLPAIELPGSARFQIGGETSSNAIGQTGEFVGLRDYQPGDPIRQIHWKSWAKTNRPIVKELEDTFYPRYGMVFDTFPAPGDELLFEDAVSVAASFAASFDTRESLLDLMFIKDRAHIVTVGRGMARTEKLLEVLAAVEAEPEEHFDTLTKLVQRYRDELTSCLVICCGWSESRAAFVRQLAGSGLECALLAVGHGSSPAGFPGHWIESGQLARDLGKLPPRLAMVRG
jgi:uncharacterized protein (DUF58 family)